MSITPKSAETYHVNLLLSMIFITSGHISIYCLSPANLVFRARSELDGFVGKDGERLEVSVFRFQIFCFSSLTPDPPPAEHLIPRDLVLGI